MHVNPNRPNPAMVAMAKRRSAAPDGPAPTGALGDTSSYAPHDPDRGSLPTRRAPRRPAQRLGGAQPYRDWSPSPGQNQNH